LSASSKERVENVVPQARPQGAASVLDFGQTEVEPAGEALSEAFALQQILASVRETAYRWDFATDRIEWAANADDVLGIADKAKIERGRAFALLVDAEQAGARYDGVTGGPHVAANTERRYCLRYRLLPEGHRGRASLWVEDTGVCCINADGHPSVAQGTLKVINDRREREERLLFLGSHDELTGQLNRTRLTEELTRFLASAAQAPAKGAFLLAGVNDLTLVNETYGYDVRDEVITIVGRRIGRALRGKDCIGRFSSNKFGVVLTDCSEEGVESIAWRLMSTIRDSVIDTSAAAVATSLSVGAVLLPEHAHNAQTGISRALQALDTARGRRGDRLSLYQPCERRSRNAAARWRWPTRSCAHSTTGV
jgi:diguanylate cyclase (GGDEF)-like protein